MTIDGDALLELARSAEQLAELRAAADDVLAKEWSADRSRDLLDGDAPAWADELWLRVCAIGWADLLVDGTVADLVVVAEAVGASTAPVPLVTAAVARWATGGHHDDTDPLTVVVPGSGTVTRGDDGTLRLSCDAPFVPYADVAARLVVHARDDDGNAVVITVPTDAEGIEHDSLRPLDMMPSAAVDLRDVRVPDDAVLTSGAEASALAEGLQLRLTLGWAAELTGVAAAANAAAVEYARERIAFGRPIGSFQAIKHRLVDQRAAIEVSRALVGRAATTLETSAPDRSALVALAAFWAGDALRAVPEGAIQVFGGIGYTWEHVTHVYLRRAAVLVALLGTRATHRDVAADWLRRR